MSIISSQVCQSYPKHSPEDANRLGQQMSLGGKSQIHCTQPGRRVVEVEQRHQDSNTSREPVFVVTMADDRLRILEGKR